MTTLQKTIIGATLVAAFGGGMYAVRRVSSWRTQVHTLQQQQSPLADLNPVRRIDAPFEISQLKDVGNASIEAAGQTVLWSVFNRDERVFDRIHYRAPEKPQLTAQASQRLLEVLANRFA